VAASPAATRWAEVSQAASPRTYTLDFYCPAAKLVVEVDGDSHGMGDNPTRDMRRDAWLRERRLRVLRFDAGDVMKDVESVVTAILLAASR